MSSVSVSVPFPSPVERTVASALLLLVSTKQPSPSLSSPQFDTDGELLLKSKSIGDEESVSLASNGSVSKRCVSSLTSDDSSASHEIRAHKLRVIAAVARFQEMKLQVVRKRRSKTSWKVTAVKPPPPPTVSSGSVSAEAGSCLSSNHVTPREKRQKIAAREKARRKKASRGGGTRAGSIHIQRRADAILRLLSSGGCSSEVKIRQLLGDSPDTSKALRMLLKLDEVKRSGKGGRQDPYIYMIA